MNDKGFWRNAGEWLGFVAPQVEVVEERQGSIDSAGGTSPLLGVIPSANRDTTITIDKAMGLVPVYRAVSVLSTATSQLPLAVWRNHEQIRTPNFVAQPDLDVPYSAFIEQTTTSLALTGNAYWRVFRASPTEPVQNIQVLNPHYINVVADPKTGRVAEYGYGDQTFKPWQIKHLMLIRMPGQVTGLGPIQAARAALSGALDLQNYATNWFSLGGVPNGVLKTDQHITPEQADAYKERWLETQSGGRGVAVLGQGFNYSPVYLSPKDAQFLESQSFSKTEIATLFGVPATYMLADAGNSQTYTNYESIDMAFVRYTLQQYLSEMEEAMTSLLPRGQNARFDLDEFLRSDTSSRYAAYAQADFMTVNEKRAKEGLPPVEGGDVLNLSKAPKEEI